VFIVLEPLFCWKIPRVSNHLLAKVDVVVGLSFGYRHGHPGKSNIVLAEAAESLYKKFGRKPLILQAEISAACHAPHISIQEHASGKIKNTFEVLSEAKAVCDARGWRKVIILAHELHLWRCMKVAERLALDPVPACVENVPFDSSSVQWWARSAPAFVCYELIARAEFLRRGYIKL
jgi:uncharacterized SAM-binding protein YcdF (DUF218 family)